LTRRAQIFHSEAGRGLSFPVPLKTLSVVAKGRFERPSSAFPQRSFEYLQVEADSSMSATEVMYPSKGTPRVVIPAINSGKRCGCRKPRPVGAENPVHYRDLRLLSP
jgi:hypothetical protein